MSVEALNPTRLEGHILSILSENPSHFSVYISKSTIYFLCKSTYQFRQMGPLMGGGGGVPNVACRF